MLWFERQLVRSLMSPELDARLTRIEEAIEQVSEIAEAYRSTLVSGQREQAAFAVPADEVVREDLAQLVPVESLQPLRQVVDAAPAATEKQVAAASRGVDPRSPPIVGVARAPDEAVVLQTADDAAHRRQPNLLGGG